MIRLLKQKKADALARARALQALAESESRVLTDAERTEFDTLMASVNGYTADIARAEALLEAERNAPASAVIEVGTNRESLRPWNSFAEQLNAVRSAALTPHRVDPRLYAPQAALGANEAVPAEGGFLVAPEYSSTILQRTYDTGLISSRCFEMPMSSERLIMNSVDEDSRVDGSRWGGLQAYWLAEAATYTGTKPKFKQLQLVANKLIGLVYVTSEQLADGPALEAYINSAVPEEFAFKIDDAIFNGTGAGIPLGIQTSAAPVVVAKDNAQAAATITNTNIFGMWKRMWPRSRATAAWFINQECEDQLWNLTRGSGTAVELLYKAPGSNGTGGTYGTIFGAPVIPVEQASQLGTQGDINLFDLRQYILAQRDGIRADSSMHVQFLTDEMVFRWTLRLDGQPMWKKPLTPKNGTSTVSAFVTLATRS